LSSGVIDIRVIPRAPRTRVDGASIQAENRPEMPPALESI